MASLHLLHSPLRATPAGLCSSHILNQVRLSSRLSRISRLWKIFFIKASNRRKRFGKPTISQRRARPHREMGSSADLSTPVDRHQFSLHYVTTPSSDTVGTTLILHFESKRYLFGSVGEGTQRACTERGISVKKVRNFFLTGETKWANNGGLLGMLLTIADTSAGVAVEEKEGLGPLNIYGGPKIWHTIACARRFIFRTGMPLEVMEANPSTWCPSARPDFYDENIRLWGLPVIEDTSVTNMQFQNPSQRIQSL